MKVYIQTNTYYGIFQVFDYEHNLLESFQGYDDAVKWVNKSGYILTGEK